jgi:hypothetical protein
VTAKVKRNSRRGRLAQAMFDKWIDVHGADASKQNPFPKRIGNKPSIWWIMAGVALEEAAVRE